MTDTDETSSHTRAVEDLSDEQAAADAHDLEAGLSELASLVIGAEGLSEVLAHVATFAVRAIPGADGAGVTLLKVDRTDHMVQVLAASHPFVAEIDEIQYVALNEGPCITAALERHTVRSGSLGGEKMWPHFGPRVGRMGIHSALSLPLLLSGKVLGPSTCTRGRSTPSTTMLLSSGSCSPLRPPSRCTTRRSSPRRRPWPLSCRAPCPVGPTIDQAIGILRQRSGVTADEAFAKLRAMSQADHVKLVEVAEKIVNEAVSRARARHVQP